MTKIPSNCNYWLFKSEPDVFSFDDLLEAPGRTTHWDGVRNYQARNLLRDEIKKGDGVLYYHSNADPLAIAGIAVVARDGYPDPSQFDPNSEYHDPKSDPENPRWFVVDVKAVKKLREPLTRARMLEEPELGDMMLLRRGARLSVQPVTGKEWRAVLRLAGL